MEQSCMAYVEKGGAPLARSRSGRTERRHRRCKRTATTWRVLTVRNLRTDYARDLHLCGQHAALFDRGLANVNGSDW